MLHIITLHIRQQSHYITTFITIIFESNISVSLSTPFETIRLTRIIERSLKHIIEEVLRDLKKTIRDFVVGVTSYRRKIGHEWFQHSVTGARDRRECCNSVKDLSFRKIGEKIDQDDFSFEVERDSAALEFNGGGESWPLTRRGASRKINRSRRFCSGCRLGPRASRIQVADGYSRERHGDSGIIAIGA